MEANEFVEKAKKIQKMKTRYRLGTYLNKEENGIYFVDCSGLIKGILWGYPEAGKYGSNKVPDMNANTMTSQCTEVTTDFTKAKPGWLVWREGHIGIYVGDGVVIESTAAWESKTLKSYLRGCGIPNKYNLHERLWTKCGKFKYIQY